MIVAVSVPPTLAALAEAVLYVPGAPERVLEVGCEEGERVLFLAREFPTARIRGLDPSAEAIAAAQARVGLDPEGRVAFKQGRARALPYPDGLFELIVQAGGSLRLSETVRVLRPGGHLLLIGRWRWLEWRLGGRRLDPVAAGEANGRPFRLARFHGDD